ncbi:hypothetical protein AXF42_Ash001974 [Apostasia shenzhenica]|uniref:Uncharacterized protein n=1 Tax=Apostasia shenzhenica TaxID=1088818 RepID=A0A2I0ABR9_9ASPA|nr:hypothetical protein AXF42_Ash001974 [Apostasia shenzhenica]
MSAASINAPLRTSCSIKVLKEERRDLGVEHVLDSNEEGPVAIKTKALDWIRLSLEMLA